MRYRCSALAPNVRRFEDGRPQRWRRDRPALLGRRGGVGRGLIIPYDKPRPRLSRGAPKVFDSGSNGPALAAIQDDQLGKLGNLGRCEADIDLHTGFIGSVGHAAIVNEFQSFVYTLLTFV